MDLTYSKYLKLDQLLQLQQPMAENEHDEMLFIVIHQVYELWFKLLLHELKKVEEDFNNGSLYDALATLKRARTIMKTLVSQIDILETMTPLSFNKFRDRLDTSSGFQSVQFRELEFFLGYKRPDMLQYHQGNLGYQRKLQERLEQPSLHDAFYNFLEQKGIAIPEAIKTKDITKPTQPSEDLQIEILRLYKNEPDFVLLFELMLDLDEGFQEWRYRHIKLVERTIGSKKGTGGSLGVKFLKQSLFHQLFPDLWAIRHEL